jgi:signal peptidase I
MTDSVSLSSTIAAEGGQSLWRPRPWRAGILNVLMPGAGQLYNGRPRRAGVSLLASVAWLLVTMTAAVAAPSRFLRIALLVTSIVTPWIVFAWDGARIAAKIQPVQRRWFQRWYALLPVIVLWGFLLQPGLMHLTKRYITEAYRIPTGSMEPTLLVGDHVLVSKWDAASPTRGTVVAFVGVAGRNFLQRVVGLPGDTLAMRGHTLVVNGREVTEPYARVDPGVDPAEDAFEWQRSYLLRPQDSATYHPTLGNWGPIAIPPGQYFTLGDNRGSSYDSRYTGLVPASQIFARGRWVYYSRAPQGGARRWSRIGVGIR